MYSDRERITEIENRIAQGAGRFLVCALRGKLWKVQGTQNLIWLGRRGARGGGFISSPPTPAQQPGTKIGKTQKQNAKEKSLFPLRQYWRCLVPRNREIMSTTTATTTTTTTTAPPAQPITAQTLLRLFPDIDTTSAGLTGYDEEQIRLMDEVCIVVDENDMPVGNASKKICESYRILLGGLQGGNPCAKNACLGK